MGSASAEVAIERVNYLVARRLALLLNQLGRAHDDAGQAIRALPGLELNERLLQRMHPVRCAEPFDCRNRLPIDRPHRQLAGAFGAAIDQQGASAALANTAPEARALELQVITKNVQERSRVVVDCNAMRLSVDHKPELVAHASVRPPGRCSAHPPPQSVIPAWLPREE